MWAATPCASPPAARIVAATSSTASCLRLLTTTAAPACARPCAMDAPMPLDAPVMMATLSLSEKMSVVMAREDSISGGRRQAEDRGGRATEDPGQKMAKARDAGDRGRRKRDGPP